MAEALMWALLVPLSRNWEPQKYGPMFDDSVWEAAVQTAAAEEINTIVIDLLDGIHYGSHPELALENAWTRQRLKKEIKRLRALGITAIPKLNFSATHDNWLGDYGKMLSTPAYYRVCRELIEEVSLLFNNPRYIHLGMDEESARHAKSGTPSVYRHGALLWHDLQFLCDCVRDNGSIPWIWSDHMFNNPEEFKANILPEDIVISPWMYSAIKKEHYTPITSRRAYIEYYGREPYKSMNLTYVEEEPFVRNFMANALPAAEAGYDIIPCVSTVNKCKYNAGDTLAYFKENAPEGRVKGYITSPWRALVESNREAVLNDIRIFMRAKREMYDGIISNEPEIDLMAGEEVVGVY